MARPRASAAAGPPDPGASAARRAAPPGGAARSRWPACDPVAMTRRFELGPLLAAAAAILLLVSLFLHWYGRVSAWDAFEVVDVALAALAVGTLLAAIGMLVP